jgi:predicted amidophosphoribosyltransferase
LSNADEDGRFRLCPRCFRAVPLASGERYCTNDGEWMLEACPGCEARIASPYARFCGNCGLEFAVKVVDGRKS